MFLEIEAPDFPFGNILHDTEPRCLVLGVGAFHNVGRKKWTRNLTIRVYEGRAGIWSVEASAFSQHYSLLDISNQCNQFSFDLSHLQCGYTSLVVNCSTKVSPVLYITCENNYHKGKNHESLPGKKL